MSQENSNHTKIPEDERQEIKKINGSSNSKGETAAQLLKSLITLDSYEMDIGDYNDPLEPSTVAPVKPKSAKKEHEDAEFAKKEAERDAALPPQYRKFRPRGYNFNIPPTDRPVRIYADGVFDLFHVGHMKQLEQAKKSLPNVTMVVGVPNDELTHKYKGLTVLSDEQRYESLRHCKWVDEVIPNAPWEVTQEFLDKHKIDYVAHDDEPYAGPDGQSDVYQFVKEQGKFLTTQRTDGISTSDIITKIIKDYDLYLMRNFKRGVSRQELNVSWIKKNELDIKNHVNEFRQSWKNNVKTTTQDLYAELLAFGLSKPENSVLNRATKWVTSKIDSRKNSIDAGSDNSASSSSSNLANKHEIIPLPSSKRQRTEATHTDQE